MLLMDYVILCGLNRRKAFKSVICASNFFNKTFEFMFQMYSTDVNYLFYTILTEQVLLYSIFNINRFLRISSMDYVILCGSNRKKAFKSVISTSNYLKYY